MRFCRKTN